MPSSMHHVPQAEQQQQNVAPPLTSTGGPADHPCAISGGSNNSSSEPQDVGAVVLKAKKAAASLWMILHAQSCRLGPDRCPHRGCSDTKRLLLHIKTCSMAPGGGYGCAERGCDSARKLLNHYKRCRDVRARQAAQLQKTNAKQDAHVCLVCSLMARHAKSMFADAKVSTDVSKTERWRARIQQQQQQQQQHQPMTQRHRSGDQPKRSVSFSFDISTTSAPMRQSKSFDEMKTFDQADNSTSPPVIPNKPVGGLTRSSSSLAMPPPPPRPPKTGANTSGIPSEISNQLSTSAPAAPSPLLLTPSNRSSSPQMPTTVFETPPSQHVLMQQRIETVAASVVAPPFSSVKASALGKSYDSSRSYFPETMVARHDEHDEQKEEQGTTITSPKRRSESFHFSDLSLQDDSLRQQGSVRTFGKRRSASCGTLTALCETIREEEADLDSDDGVFEMH